MQVTFPSYYNAFSCIADACPDTCCAGWQIMIDDRSLKKYRRFQGTFRNRLHNDIDWEEHAFRQYGHRCAFLNEEGRCSVHPYRPGICRLFPLGRVYEEESFRYFLQTDECKKENRTKVKVKKWLDTPDLKQYEKFVWDWHQFLLDVQEVFYQTEDTELIKNLNMYVISRFYTKPYEEAQDFYAQFYERLKEAKNLLSLGV